MDKVITTFTVAGVVIKKDGRYLLVQERQPKAYGLWNLPAGKVEIGATIEETAIKEAREETGYAVELLYPIKIFHASAESPVGHSFAAKIVSGTLHFPEDEILDAAWFTLEEIRRMKSKLRSSKWVLESIENYDCQKGDK